MHIMWVNGEFYWKKFILIQIYQSREKNFILSSNFLKENKWDKRHDEIVKYRFLVCKSWNFNS
jgi:hypothetical protein